jgi:hypothetical protein
VTGRPLRPVTDHRLGELLPHQLANRTQAPPKALPLRATFLLRDYAVLANVSIGCPPLLGRFLRVPHPSAARHHLVLLLSMLPLDLHVLGVPPAFNLSQDQTLHFFKSCIPLQVRLSPVPPQGCLLKVRHVPLAYLN